mgnify:CR=1 FL=1
MELTDRQRELAEVALGIVAADGMAAVTFRSVAAASGWSFATHRTDQPPETALLALHRRLAPG